MTRLHKISLFDLALEQGALGAAMLSPAQAEVLIRDAHPLMFSTGIHRNIFAAIRSLGARHLDYTLLLSEMERQGNHVPLDVLTRLDYGVVPEIPMARRIDRLKELHRLRLLAGVAEALESRVHAPCASSADIVRWLRAELQNIVEAPSP